MKKNEILPFTTTWKNLENIHLYVESKKYFKWIYMQNRNRLSDVENKHGCEWGKGERDKLGVWD